MTCVRCNINPPAVTRTVSCGEVGFCLDCWEKIDISGSCKCCGNTWDLFVHAMWFDKIIEHICGTCKATEACV